MRPPPSKAPPKPQALCPQCGSPQLAAFPTYHASIYVATSEEVWKAPRELTKSWEQGHPPCPREALRLDRPEHVCWSCRCGHVWVLKPGHLGDGTPIPEQA